MMCAHQAQDLGTKTRKMSKEAQNRNLKSWDFMGKNAFFSQKTVILGCLFEKRQLP